METLIPDRPQLGPDKKEVYYLGISRGKINDSENTVCPIFPFTIIIFHHRTPRPQPAELRGARHAANHATGLVRRKSIDYAEVLWYSLGHEQAGLEKHLTKSTNGEQNIGKDGIVSGFLGKE
jgi:hypothetical protein